MVLSQKRGDVCTATEDYIVQQCCCASTRPFGLSDVISKKWPSVNPYASRKKLNPRSSLAVKEDRPIPGTYKAYTDERKVICLFAQYNPGKAGAYSDSVGKDVPDSSVDRLQYFDMSLRSAIEELNPASLAIPYKIGCGYAGGSWDKYKKCLEKIQTDFPDTKITLYVYDG